MRRGSTSQTYLDNLKDKAEWLRVARDTYGDFLVAELMDECWWDDYAGNTAE